jgi:hypothetical protein
MRAQKGFIPRVDSSSMSTPCFIISKKFLSPKANLIFGFATRFEFVFRQSAYKKD